MKSNSAINKVAPNSPLNIKLREIHDIKRAINNSHMPEDIKKAMMSTCDSQMNQAWRWHYEGKPGYEADRDCRARVRRVLAKRYGMRVDASKKSHLYATNECIHMMVVSPCELTENKWMLRVSAMATFDHWNSTAIEKLFDCPEHIAFYLEEHMDAIYKKVLESLSRDVGDRLYFMDNMKNDSFAVNKDGESDAG